MHDNFVLDSLKVYCIHDHEWALSLFIWAYFKYYSAKWLWKNDLSPQNLPRTPQAMVTYPLNLEWVCNTFSNTLTFYPIFQMKSTFFLLSFALCACTSLVRCEVKPQKGGAEQRPGKEKVSIKIFYKLTNKTSQMTLNNCWFYQSIRCWSGILMAVGV